MVVTFRQAQFEREVAPLNIALFVKTLPKRGNWCLERLERARIQNPNHRLRLLRARGERARHHRAAEGRDELASPHVGHRAPFRVGAAGWSTARSACSRAASRSLGQT